MENCDDIGLCNIIPEGTTTYHALQFLNFACEEVVPSSVHYRLISGIGSVLIDWTGLPPEAAEIEIPAEFNTIAGNGRTRYLTVETEYNNGRTTTEDLIYYLRDLAGIWGDVSDCSRC